MTLLATTTQDSLSVWSALAAAILALLAAICAFFPRFLLFLAATTNQHVTPDTYTVLTPLEAFLAVQLALVLAALSLTLILNIPSPEAPEAIPTGALNYNPVTQATATQPLLLPLSLAALLSALHAWNAQGVGALGLLVFAGSLTVGLWGMWEIVFAGSSSVSKTTGADKRTSAFLFGNKAAASSQKKSFRKGQ